MPKQGIHPKWYPNATVVCSCGNTFTVGSTQPSIRTDVCANCHPFYTGEQRIVDTAGRVDRFMMRLERREQRAQQVQAAQTKSEEKAKPAAAKGRR
ncbi:MAG: 50S ribosomal protein L31 [Anaerolineae bacterium]|nr:50S ribosomal protein L31 [Anaerolineae bacterium]